MNSEELEQSLRTEFESYLKTVRAEMKQDVAEFQTKIEAEFDKHRAQTSEAFEQFAARFDSDKEFDQGFSQLVAEHLKLARDEGAKLSATAYAEAEKLDASMAAAAPAPANYAGIRDAIADISSKDSQSTILKSLIEHAEKFAPRGAFFIIKNEHFAGWKVFGDEADVDENTIRDIHFAASDDSILGKAITSKTTAEASFGAHSADPTFLDPLDFGHPDRMYAIPLIARGRGVAVMYADEGSGVPVNLEALETLVSVAGLTVELLASSQTAKAENREMAAADFEDTQGTAETPATHTTEADPASPFASEAEPADFKFSDSVSYSGGFPVDYAEETVPTAEEYKYEPDESAEPAAAFEPAETVEALETFTPAEEPYAVEEESAVEPEPEVAEEVEPETESEPEPEAELESETEPEEEEQPVADSHVEPFNGFEPSAGTFAFDHGTAVEPVEPEPAVASPFETSVEPFAPTGTIGGSGIERAPVPVVELAAPSAPQARLSDRPVDLPIEVADDERRLHTDARRFARLLVSEIKLYNEKKVIEGREAHDLYERLREAIDRSREMYDKRVQPPVAARFDYFHYELLNTLAEGNPENFGNGYPGATV